VIVSLDLFPREGQLGRRSVIAYESIDRAPQIIVRLSGDDGRIGWGNAAPDYHVTGETAASVQGVIRETLRPLLLGADESRTESLWARMRRTAPGSPSAVAALDIALYDLLGKRAGAPLAFLLGSAREEIATSITLSIARIDETVERARELVVGEGYRALKIKCGLDPEEDIARARAVREAVGPEIALSMDANQGYSVEQTLRVATAVFDLRLAFIEQPVAAGDLEGMREVCARSPIPVMADESVLDARDALATPAPLINLKLMKTGGITGALKANAVAEARGVRTMIGCMDESRISMAAAAHLALALENIAWADLDGHLDLVDDPARGGLEIIDGMVGVGPAAGLGVEVMI
jgi:L-alanine-DL-glutamate epimerase-like enolase superfamily enzyme